MIRLNLGIAPFLLAVCLMTTNTSAQGAESRLITWSHLGQREEVRRGDRVTMIYKFGIAPEATYLKYHETLGQDSYVLELNALPYTYRDTIALSRGICVPADGSTPVIATEVTPDKRRGIVFSTIGQQEKVLNGECIHLTYDSSIATIHTYLLYSSTDDGYTIELSRLGEDRQVHFERRCQSFIVASPLTTRVSYSDLIRYEQIIWTPCANGQWEVRVGSVQMGCYSEPLKRLKELHTKEYMSNVPVERKTRKER